MKQKIPTQECPFCQKLLTKVNLEKLGSYLKCEKCPSQGDGHYKYDVSLNKKDKVVSYSIYLHPFEITNYVQSNYTEIFDWSKSHLKELMIFGLTSWNLYSEKEIRNKINLLLMMS